MIVNDQRNKLCGNIYTRNYWHLLTYILDDVKYQLFINYKARCQISEDYWKLETTTSVTHHEVKVPRLILTPLYMSFGLYNINYSFCGVGVRGVFWAF